MGLRGIVGHDLFRAIALSVALAAVSLLVPSAPTTDPWGWIVWGRELMHLQLDTVGGPPSWKPLPVLVTAPLSLLGSAAPSAWLVVARAGGLLALWLAYRLAARFVGPAGGVLAALALALSHEWLRNLAHGYSEPLAVALLLGAVECHLQGRRTPALILGSLVSLARPEAWPLVVLYGIAVAPRRPLVVVAVLAPPLLWVLPDWWGSGNPLHAASVAGVNLERAGENPALALLRTGLALLPAPVWLTAALGVVLACRRRVGAVAALGVIAAAWFAAVVIATALHYPGTSRFLVLPAALACVIAGIGAVWAARAALRRAAVPALALAAIALVLGAVANLTVEARRTVERARFQHDLRQAAVLARADHRTPVIVDGLWWNAGALAWELHVPLSAITTVSDAGLARLDGVHPPATVFAPLGDAPPDDKHWRPTHRVARCGVDVAVRARVGAWRALSITPATPPQPGCRAPSRAFDRS